MKGNQKIKTLVRIFEEIVKIATYYKTTSTAIENLSFYGILLYKIINLMILLLILMSLKK